MSTRMQFDSRDVWPDEDPVTPGIQVSPGKFDVVDTTVEGYPGVTARIQFICPNAEHCGVLLAPQPIPRADKNRLYVWGWDGNREAPTLTPSINCLAVKEDGTPAGGCGWHGFITAGVMK